MNKQRSVPISLLIAALFVLTFGGYFGAYAACLQPTIVTTVEGDLKTGRRYKMRSIDYRYDSDVLRMAFMPAHIADLIVRQGYWREVLP